MANRLPLFDDNIHDYENIFLNLDINKYIKLVCYVWQVFLFKWGKTILMKILF